ncbi:MAG: hypothetical protein HY445_02330 [Candidatus Niyogibacteria bacterium]|nr:hypothetical protein [Candidatus Niyogibacteria bacterium]
MVEISKSAEPGEKGAVYVSGNSWTDKGLNELLVSMKPKERFDFLEKRFLESVEAYNDENALELLELLRRAYFELNRAKETEFAAIDKNFVCYFGRLHAKLSDLKIKKEDEILQKPPAFINTKVKIFQSILSFWKPENPVNRRAFEFINTMFSPMHGYVSKAEEDKMRPLLQKHLEENFSWEELRFFRNYPTTSEKMQILLSGAILRKAGSIIVEREIILDAIFEDIDIDVTKFSKEKIEEIRNAIKVIIQKKESPVQKRESLDRGPRLTME